MSIDRFLALLADGRFHSGTTLAGELGMSRAAVWKRASDLRELGLDVHAVRGKGYRLHSHVVLLNADRIRERLSKPTLDALDSLVAETVVDSTNARLMMSDVPPAGKARVCLAEYQTAGRGRRGRHWQAPFGSGLCLSIGYNFADLPADIGVLSLATGVVVVEALARENLSGVGLKWPNDIIWQRRKLGGVLVELIGVVGGPAYAVIGVGINTALPQSVRDALEAGDYRVADLSDIAGATPDRNVIAAAVIDRIIQMLKNVETVGFADSITHFRRYDVLKDEPVTVRFGDERFEGVAAGVDRTGAFILNSATGKRTFSGGEVTVRTGR